METDQVFKSPNFPLPFCFNAEVADVFDDMITRSVPGYLDMLSYALSWAKRIVEKDDIVYDIGCSTGTLFSVLKNHVDARFIGIDTSSPMLEKAKDKHGEDCQFILSSGEDFQFDRAKLYFANYTLQFMKIRARKKLLAQIAENLKPGGMVFISEKLRSEHSLFAEGVTEDYENFKRKNGYGDDEISRKKMALENVLIPTSEAEFKTILIESGFNKIECILKNMHFATYIVQK